METRGNPSNGMNPAVLRRLTFLVVFNLRMVAMYLN
jgi:hypothetical protein